jgi:hypothetical protein
VNGYYVRVLTSAAEWLPRAVVEQRQDEGQQCGTETESFYSILPYSSIHAFMNGIAADKT